MITLTLIRHGESEDNLICNWAGWNDTPLTALGEQQVDALGAAFSALPIHFQHLYTSDLCRTQSTAFAIMKHHTNPKPLLLTTQKLRGQHYGIAEGRTRLETTATRPIEEMYAEGIFPRLGDRDARFPGGESPNDLARRAEEALKEYIIPHVLDSAQDGANIALISHGYFLSEVIPALLRMDPSAVCDRSYHGHLNTAWSRFKISVRESYKGDYDLKSPPPLQVQLVAFNSYDHLRSLLPSVPTNGEALVVPSREPVPRVMLIRPKPCRYEMSF